MPHHPDSRLNATALLALLIGIFGSVCFFWGIGGIGAIVLGSVALSEIKRSEGRQHGAGLATAGIVLGVVHLAVLVVGLGVLFALAARSPSAALRPTPVPAPAPGPPVLIPPSPGASANPEAREAGGATREAGTRITRFGGVTVVDPGTEAGTLDTLIAAERTTAAANHETLVVWLTTPGCQPCAGVSVALTSRRLQQALSGVRLLRLDLRDFQLELARRGYPIDVTPGFALVGSRGEPADYVNGGEWDADIPENIAPVLGKFVRGSYRQRRTPWRGALRGDETAL